MKNLIKAEFFKLKKSTAYKSLLVIYLIIEVVVTINNISNSIAYPKYNPSYTGVEWLLNPRKSVMLYMVILFLFTAFYVNGDFTAHTFYTCLLCGIPRKKAFQAKIILLFAGGFPLLLVHFLTGTVIWSVYSGFGMEFGTEAVFLIAKAFARWIRITLILVSHTVLFSVIARSKTGTFGWSFGTFYLFGVLRGNIGNIITVPAVSKIFMLLLSLSYLNSGISLLKLLAAGYIFERFDLK